MSNGKYDVQGAHNLAHQVYQTSPEKMEKAKQVVETCAKEGNTHTLRLLINSPNKIH